jgi:L,D-peptidoglycan transpeptidase YkuD (ErfK/YbiS/YcfS/YnhG family)
MLKQVQHDGLNRKDDFMPPITELRLTGPTTLEEGGKVYECRIGRAGVAAAGAKREGDMMTPSGRFPMRCVYYRPDRVDVPATGLPVIALTPDDGWCDDVGHPMYNQPVKLPFDGRHEILWREDHVYDLIIPLGYNDAPIVAGAGSAIFMHLMREDGVGTEGCVALKREDLLALLARCDVSTVVIV